MGVFRARDNLNSIFRSVHSFQEQLFGSIIGSRSFHNDTYIEVQPMDVKQSRQSEAPPSPSQHHHNEAKYFKNTN